jgi:8-oxo-dGTP diphosphatase
MTIVVVAAVVIDRGRVLVTQRPRGSHLAGMWEFPGGKVEDGEDPRAALQRELREEIGVDANVGDVLEVTFHRYPEKDILLLFFHTSLQPFSPPPSTLDVAAIAWRTYDELLDEDFPPADVTILERVRERLRQMS